VGDREVWRASGKALLARGLVGLGASGACCTTSFAARADEAAAEQSELEAEEGIPLSQAPDWYRPNPWYGWQTLVVDAVSIPVSYEGNRSSHHAPAALGFVGYLVVSPVIHLAHGEWLNGLGSFGVRIALPVASGAIALELASDCRDDEPGWDFFLRDCQETALNYGVLIGQAAAAGVDAILLGHRRGDDVAVAPPSIAPTFSLARGGGMLGLAGAF
jgi:hypothetical protein